MKSQPAAPSDDILRFGDFTLDPANRRLTRGAEPVELGGRYLDVLIMLARAPGQLISKERLHEEVWRGIPVTDEALSQAIMALRRALGDDAARPRFIETVPRHGYRFVGTVESAAAFASAPGALAPTRSETVVTVSSAPSSADRGVLAAVTGGILGAGAAGLMVGLIYGMLAARSDTGNAISLVMVLVCVSVLAALVSGLGIAGGIGLALRGDGKDWWRPVAGGALGGLVVGGFARLLGSDTLRLLMGSAPDRMAGAIEGLAIGAVVGFGYHCLAADRGYRRHVMVALLGSATGLALVATGGAFMAGSLASLVDGFPSAGVSMAWTRDPALLALSGAFEGGIFAALASAGMAVGARRRMGDGALKTPSPSV